MSCSNDMKDISRFDRQQRPDQEILDGHIWRSNEGKLQLELDAPRIVQFRTPDTRTIYPNGVELRFYDGDRRLQTFIRADRATSYDDRNILTAKDSVVSSTTPTATRCIWKTSCGSRTRTLSIRTTACVP